MLKKSEFLVWSAKKLSLEWLDAGGSDGRKRIAAHAQRRNWFVLISEKSKKIVFYMKGAGEMWSGANSYASKGAIFSFAESGQLGSALLPKPDKNYMEKGCLVYSGYETQLCGLY